eukprot:TRINITY_DN18381_c0_g3_i1.p1 TRINITY_DN18381_c0_g3~~TRINITY_DN18381_c0_g3_i1.p1  ORF type:complete len:636 (-),score=83.93 TRINITY_DN18381_c0_g3_i1:68-1891(-)
MKRVDPSDGLAYTYEELSAYYAGKYKKADIQKYWNNECTEVKAPKSQKSSQKSRKKNDDEDDKKDTKAQVDSEESTAVPSSAGSPKAKPPSLRRSRSWLVKIGGITLLPCEESLQPLIEDYVACVASGDALGIEAAQLNVLKRHPFVVHQAKEAPSAALAEGVSCKISNFKMNVNQFKKWLKTDAGKPFEEKGKGYDDGCYLTSAVLRAFMPRGYTHYEFENASGDKASAVLRGFFKFTGLTAADEDEESNATNEASSFMFHGYTMEDASRFVVTTKSNGENGKYAIRNIFGEWYCLAGSKNTGVVWKFGADVSSLYPIPRDSIAAVGPKIVSHSDELVTKMAEKTRKDFFTHVDSARLTVMIEWNDDTHEHIYPITTSWGDHVAVLDARGYPLPQAEAYKFFDKYDLRRVKCDSHESMSDLSKIMEEIRTSTDTEGAVIYLERTDDTAVGLIKVKSNHYVIARRTREILRSSLIRASNNQADLSEPLETSRKRIRTGMKALTHVGGCEENHAQWAEHAIAFATKWAKAYEAGNRITKHALVEEFHSKFGSLYERFSRSGEVLPLSDFSMDVASAAVKEQTGAANKNDTAAENSTGSKKRGGRNNRK